MESENLTRLFTILTSLSMISTMLLIIPLSIAEGISRCDAMFSISLIGIMISITPLIIALIAKFVYYESADPRTIEV